MKLLCILLLISSTSQASFRNFCRRNFIDVDPYQYNGTSLEWLTQAYKQEAVAAYYKHKLSRRLFILGNTIRLIDELPDEVKLMLENYQTFEDGKL